MLTEEQKKLVEKNINLVYFVLWKYKFDVEEDLDIGYIYLCRAAATYDPNLHIRFSTFATKVIYNGIKSSKNYRNTKRKQFFDSMLSLDLTYDSDDDHDTLSLKDLIPNKEYSVYKQMLLNDWRRNLQEFIDSLSPDHQTIFIDFYFKNKSQVDIGKALNISQAQVSRLLGILCNKFKKTYYKDFDIIQELQE